MLVISALASEQEVAVIRHLELAAFCSRSGPGPASIVVGVVDLGESLIATLLIGQLVEEQPEAIDRCQNVECKADCKCCLEAEPTEPLTDWQLVAAFAVDAVCTIVTALLVRSRPSAMRADAIRG